MRGRVALPSDLNLPGRARIFAAADKIRKKSCPHFQSGKQRKNQRKKTNARTRTKTKPSKKIQGDYTHGKQSWSSLHGPRGGGDPQHRLPEISDREPQMRTRRHSQDRIHQHLRQRPAHGPGPYHRAQRTHPGTRDHRRSDRGGAGCRVYQGRGSGFGALQHCLRPLPKL